MEKGPMQIDMLSNPWLGYEVTDEYVKCLQLLALFFFGNCKNYYNCLQ